MGLYGLGFVLGKLPLLEWILSKQEHFNFCLSEEEESGSNEVALRVSLVRKQQSIK